MRWGLKIGLPVVLLVILIGAVVAKSIGRREGVTNRKSQDPENTPRAGLPQGESALGNIPSEKEEKKMFPGVPWGNLEAAQSIMPEEPTKVPSAPSAMLEQIMGYLQPLGAAPDLSIGDGDGAAAFDLLFEQGDDRPIAPEDISKTRDHTPHVGF